MQQRVCLCRHRACGTLALARLTASGKPRRGLTARLVMDFERYFSDALDSLKAEGRYRTFAELERLSGDFPKARYRSGNQVREVTVWCSNDYLAMGQHPEVAQAMKTAIDSQGAGVGGTRNISGTNVLHVELEAELARLHNKEAGLIFTSGYVSNLSGLGTLCAKLPNVTVFSDELNHASMIEAMRASRANKVIYRHNDPEDLREKLALAPEGATKIVAFESVYSMEGDMAPLHALCDVAQEFGALTYLDEVHAVGLYGENGGGLSELQGAAHRIDVIEGTLAKAFGVMGGYITGSANLVDFVRSFSSSFIFTTALPPSLTAGALTSLRLIRDGHALRTHLAENAALLKQELAKVELPVLPGPSHIVPVIVGDADLCRAASKLLLEKHAVYVQPINYPTVPRRTERLRLTPTPAHTAEDIAYLVQAIDSVWRELDLPRKLTEAL